MGSTFTLQINEEERRHYTDRERLCLLILFNVHFLVLSVVVLLLHIHLASFVTLIRLIFNILVQFSVLDT